MEINHAFDRVKKNSLKKTRTRPRKRPWKKGLAQENMHSAKKASTKKRTRSRKNDNGQESNQETALSFKKIKKRFKLF